MVRQAQTVILERKTTVRARIKPASSETFERHECYKLAITYFWELIFFTHDLLKIWSPFCDYVREKN